MSLCFCFNLIIPYRIQAMDMFDMGSGFDSLLKGVARIKCPTLVSSIVRVLLLLVVYTIITGVRCIL